VPPPPPPTAASRPDAEAGGEEGMLPPLLEATATEGEKGAVPAGLSSCSSPPGVEEKRFGVIFGANTTDGATSLPTRWLCGERSMGSPSEARRRVGGVQKSLEEPSVLLRLLRR